MGIKSDGLLLLIFWPLLSTLLVTSDCGAEEIKGSEGTVYYIYKDRDHSIKEEVLHLTALYTLGWMTYYVTQTENFHNHGSFHNYRQNFGKLVFDQEAYHSVCRRWEELNPNKKEKYKNYFLKYKY